MITVYRIFAPYRDPWDDWGSFRYGGRWNSPGRRVLYTASSLALACLEVLVHYRNVNLTPELRFSMMSIAEEQVESWTEHPLRAEALLDSLVLSREWGDNHLSHEKYKDYHPVAFRRNLKPVLQVPSKVIPKEWNYLVDSEVLSTRPLWQDPEPFKLDPRLLNAAIR